MVCACAREDNPRALASGLLPEHTQKLYNNLLIAHAYVRTLCIAIYFMVNIGIHLQKVQSISYIIAHFIDIPMFGIKYFAMHKVQKHADYCIVLSLYGQYSSY